MTVNVSMLRGQAHHLTHPHPAKSQRTGHCEVTHPQVTSVVAGSHRAPTVITVCPSTSIRRRSAGWGLPCSVSICAATVDIPTLSHIKHFRRIETKGKPHVTPRAVHPLPEVWAPDNPVTYFRCRPRSHPLWDVSMSPVQLLVLACSFS